MRRTLIVGGAATLALGWGLLLVPFIPEPSQTVTGASPYGFNVTGPADAVSLTGSVGFTVSWTAQTTVWVEIYRCANWSPTLGCVAAHLIASRNASSGEVGLSVRSGSVLLVGLGNRSAGPADVRLAATSPSLGSACAVGGGLLVVLGLGTGRPRRPAASKDGRIAICSLCGQTFPTADELHDHDRTTHSRAAG